MCLLRLLLGSKDVTRDRTARCWRRSGLSARPSGFGVPQRRCRRKRGRSARLVPRIGFISHQTQICPVFFLAGNAATRVGGDDVIGFVFVHCGCTFRYGCLRLALLAFLGLILDTDLIRSS
jgi:hypothetical protein